MTADNNVSSEPAAPAPQFVDCVDNCVRPIDECVQLAEGGWCHRSQARETPDGWYILARCVLCVDDVWRTRDNSIQLESGEWVDNECEEIVQLADGDYTWTELAVNIDGEWYRDCDTFCCDCCCDTFHDDDAYRVGGCSYCESCYDSECSTCDACGDSTHNTNLHENDEGQLLCPMCRSPRLVSDYGDRSANKMVPESNDKILYGIELEVEPRGGNEDEGAKFVRKHLLKDYCVLKHDGSLGAGGFEIVTRPDSVAVHRDKWQQLFDHSPSDWLRSWNTGRCGMHVHVSRHGLSQLQIGKMLCFLNSPLNASFVVKVAGRRCDRWSRIYPKKIKDVWGPQERYVALNLCNSRTIEFRIFRGTLNRSTFFKNIEFCAALVEFCSPATHSIADATSARCFMQWVDYQKYPNLYDWLVRRGFIIDRRKRRRSA